LKFKEFKEDEDNKNGNDRMFEQRMFENYNGHVHGPFCFVSNSTNVY